MVVSGILHLSGHMKKNLGSEILTWSDTNQAVRPQKMARNIRFRKKSHHTICGAKTKALIRCAVTKLFS